MSGSRFIGGCVAGTVTDVLNFSFNIIVETILVPVNQQMAVFGELQIESGGELQVEGSVVIEV